MMIIDAHCHAGEGDGLTGPWDTRARLAPYLRRAAAAGIARTVVFAPIHSDYRAANRRVAAIVHRFHSRLIGFAFVHPERDCGRITPMVREAVERYGFRGIKVHRRDAPLTREVCETARQFRLPVLYDPLGDAHPVSLVAREYPDVDFIIPHLGSFGDDWQAHETVIDLMVRLPNVYGDTAGVRRFDYLVEAARRAGSAKIIFGSDGPFLHPDLEVRKIRLLTPSPADQAAILGGNISRLLARTCRPRDGFSAPGSVQWRQSAYRLTP
jgi:predicted TIM-barrel fold metal-dependent hydrolase